MIARPPAPLVHQVVMVRRYGYGDWIQCPALVKNVVHLAGGLPPLVSVVFIVTTGKYGFTREVRTWEHIPHASIAIPNCASWDYVTHGDRWTAITEVT